MLMLYLVIYHCKRSTLWTLLLPLLLLMMPGEGSEGRTPGALLLSKRIIFQDFFVRDLTTTCYGTCAKGGPTNISRCEGNLVRLNCPRRYTVKIQSAWYGKLEPGEELCSQRDGFKMKPKCRNNSTIAVATKCEGQRTCSFLVIKPQFTHGCLGSYKYLDVQFLCVFTPETTPAPPTTTIPTTTTTTTTQPTTTAATTIIQRAPTIVTTTVTTTAPTTTNATSSTTIIPMPRSEAPEGRSFFWILTTYSLLSETKFMKANLTHMSLAIILSIFIGLIVSLCFILDHCRRKRGSYDKTCKEMIKIVTSEDDLRRGARYAMEDHEMEDIDDIYCNESGDSSVASRGNGRVGHSIKLSAAEMNSLEPLLSSEIDEYGFRDDIREGSDSESSRDILKGLPAPPEEFLTDESSPEPQSDSANDRPMVSGHIANGQPGKTAGQRRDPNTAGAEQSQRGTIFVNEKALASKLQQLTKPKQQSKRVMADNVCHNRSLVQHDAPDELPHIDVPALLLENPQKSFGHVEEIANSIEMLKTESSPSQARSRTAFGHRPLSPPLSNGPDYEHYDSSSSSNDGGHQNEGQADRHIRFGPTVDSGNLLLNMEALSQQEKGKLHKLHQVPSQRRSCLRQSSLNKENRNMNAGKSMISSASTVPSDQQASNNQEHAWHYTEHRLTGQSTPDIRQPCALHDLPGQSNQGYANRGSPQISQSCDRCCDHLNAGGEPYGPKRKKFQRNKSLPDAEPKKIKPTIRKSHSLHTETTTPNSSPRPSVHASSLPRRQNQGVVQCNKTRPKSVSPTKHLHQASLGNHVGVEQDYDNQTRTFPRNQKVKWQNEESDQGDSGVSIAKIESELIQISSPQTNSLRRSNSMGTKTVALNGKVSRSPSIKVNGKLREKQGPPVQVRPKYKLHLRHSPDVTAQITATSL